MGRPMSGNRGGARLSVGASRFPASIVAGTQIAPLSLPFGAGTALSLVGSAPPQLALASGRIVAGATAPNPGERYTIKIRAVSADGAREIAETFAFDCIAGLPIDMLMVIGDSNARGGAADEPSLAFAADTSILTWDNQQGRFVSYQPGTFTGCVVPNTTATANTHVGPELQFARDYRTANPAKALAIVKYAKSGAFQGYGAGAPVNGDATLSWDAGSGQLLGLAKQAVADARGWLIAAGYAPRLIAIIDASGTNDASDATLAGQVQAAKIAMYAALRTMPAFVTSVTTILTQRQKADSPQTNINTVRLAQAAAANASADAILVASDGFGDNGTGDRTHFNLAGQVQLGDAHYAAWSARLTQRIVALGSKARLFLDAAQADTIGFATAPAVGSIAGQVSGLTLAQATVANQPLLVTGASGINGRAALDCDGVNDALLLTGSNALGSGAREFFAIVASDAPGSDTGGRVILARGGGSSNADFRLGRTSSGGVSRFYMQAGGANTTNYRAADTTVVAEGVHVVAGRFDPAVGSNGTLYVSVDGGGETAAALGNALNVGDGYLTLGSANASFWFDGRIRLVLETLALTSTERAALIADLKAEAGL